MNEDCVQEHPHPVRMRIKPGLCMEGVVSGPLSENLVQLGNVAVRVFISTPVVRAHGRPL